MGDLWEAAAQISREKSSKQGSHRMAGRSLIVIGSKSSSYQSILRSITEKKSESKSTVGIHYSYVHRQDDNELIPETGHIWEIDASPNLSETLQTLLTSLNSTETMFFLVCDLSKPEYILSWLQLALNETSKAMNSVSNSKAEIKREVWIIANRFDAYQGLEPEKKKLITQTLLQITAHYGFGLMYYSSQIPACELKVNSLSKNWFFGNELIDMPLQVDPAKLVFVPPNGKFKNSVGQVSPVLDAMTSSLNTAVLQRQDPGVSATKDEAEAKLYHEPEVNAIYDLVALGTLGSFSKKNLLK